MSLQKSNATTKKQIKHHTPRAQPAQQPAQSGGLPADAERREGNSGRFDSDVRSSLCLLFTSLSIRLPPLLLLPEEGATRAMINELRGGIDLLLLLLRQHQRANRSLMIFSRAYSYV